MQPMLSLDADQVVADVANLAAVEHLVAVANPFAAVAAAVHLQYAAAPAAPKLTVADLRLTDAAAVNLPAVVVAEQVAGQVVAASACPPTDVDLRLMEAAVANPRADANPTVVAAAEQAAAQVVAASAWPPTVVDLRLMEAAVANPHAVAAAELDAAQVVASGVAELYQTKTAVANPPADVKPRAVVAAAERAAAEVVVASACPPPPTVADLRLMETAVANPRADAAAEQDAAQVVAASACPPPVADP